MAEPGVVQDLLRAGIAAAQAGQKEKARQLLTRVVEEDDKNVRAWLWLSGVVDGLDNREMCLQQVLALEPGNELAQRGLDRIRRQRLEELLRAGIAAAEKGQRDHARRLLTQVVEQDEGNLQAWVRLSELVDSLEDREVCLENALTLDPGNESLQRKLEGVRRQREDQAAVKAEVLARAVPGLESGAEEAAPAVAAPATPVEAIPPRVEGEFPDAYLCPYCAAPTDPKDRKCQACRNRLWTKTRKREERSPWLWMAVGLQLGVVVADSAGYVLLLMYLAMWSGAESALDLMPTYFGLGDRVSPEVAQAALALVPRAGFFAASLAVLSSLVVLVGLFMRWRPFFFLFLINAVFSTVLAIAALLLARGPAIPCGAVMVLCALALIWLAFQMQDDFFYDRTRLLMQAHREAVSGLDFLMHARRYARSRMWALAALHFQRAAAWLPDPLEAELGLAAACIRLKRHDRAEEALGEASRRHPDDPRVRELAATLQQLRASAVRPAGPQPGP